MIRKQAQLQYTFMHVDKHTWSHLKCTKSIPFVSVSDSLAILLFCRPLPPLLIALKTFFKALFTTKHSPKWNYNITTHLSHPSIHPSFHPSFHSPIHSSTYPGIHGDRRAKNNVMEFSKLFWTFGFIWHPRQIIVISFSCKYRLSILVCTFFNQSVLDPLNPCIAT